MVVILSVLGVIVLLVLAYLAYRYWAFRRESAAAVRLRFERVAPILDALEHGRPVTSEQVLPYAKDNKTRKSIYHLLEGFDLTDLFPEAFNTEILAAESDLVNWLEFPTELDAAPDEIEHVNRVPVDLEGEELGYHVFRFCTHAPHWAAADGWMLGVVGPFFPDGNPYDHRAGTFSRFMKQEEMTPQEEVEWVHKNIFLNRKQWM